MPRRRAILRLASLRIRARDCWLSRQDQVAVTSLGHDLLQDFYDRPQKATRALCAVASRNALGSIPGTDAREDRVVVP